MKPQLTGARMMGREKYGRGEKQHFVVHVDNEPQQTAKATQELLKANKMFIFQWPSQSPDPSLVEQLFSY